VRLASIRAVAFDKTGTLTAGEPLVESAAYDDDVSPGEMITVAAALAQRSTHPLSRAIVRFAAPLANEARGVKLTGNVESAGGRGVAGRTQIHGVARLGSRRYLVESDMKISDSLRSKLDSSESAGHAMVAVGWNGRVAGFFTLREAPRREAAESIAALRARGLTMRVLSGDLRSRCAALSADLDVPVVGELLPEDKLGETERLRAEYGVAAMVGDGLNDAPALAAADVGIALGCGADVTRESGDVCLLSNDLSRLPWAIALAQRTVRTIRWNLVWAFAYNVGGVALAAAGWLNPIFAAIAMTASSVMVITNSLRLAHDEEMTAHDEYVADATANSGAAPEGVPQPLPPPARRMRPPQGGCVDSAAPATL
jgi:cation transport ATPase